jgi:hypothetical protein
MQRVPSSPCLNVMTPAVSPFCVIQVGRSGNTCLFGRGSMFCQQPFKQISSFFHLCEQCLKWHGLHNIPCMMNHQLPYIKYPDLNQSDSCWARERNGLPKLRLCTLMIFPALLPPPGLQPIKITQTTGMDPSCETKPEITSSELASIIKAMSFFFTCDLKVFQTRHSRCI